MRYLLSALCCAIAFSVHAGFEGNFSKEATVPEPMLFDLVRRINSDKGELEVNTLIVHGPTEEMEDLYVAPEIEWAFGQGKAAELELPTQHGEIKSYKGALQFKLAADANHQIGTQIIYEKLRTPSHHQITPLLLLAHKISSPWSTFTMIGNRFSIPDGTKQAITHHEFPILNGNIFYDYNDTLDLGLELNLKGLGASYEELIALPQMHVLMSKDIKIQMGIGTSYDGYRFSPLSALRLIKEFNH